MIGLKKVTLIFCSLLVTGSAFAQPYTTPFSNGEIIIDTVKRSSDDTVLVRGKLKNTTESSDFYLGTSGLVTDYVFSIRLQDLKTKKQYEQVTVEKIPVGSVHKTVIVRPGESVPIWARITAPPKDVREVTILFSGDAPPIDAATISD